MLVLYVLQGAQLPAHASSKLFILNHAQDLSEAVKSGRVFQFLRTVQYLNVKCKVGHFFSAFLLTQRKPNHTHRDASVTMKRYCGGCAAGAVPQETESCLLPD